MKIIEISLKLGSTVNLGDYNNFRPEIGGKAVVEPFDDPDQVFIELEEQLAEHLARLVDDELERAGREPRYASDLYMVQYSDLRQCVVVARAGIELPVESNWKDRDEWNRISYDLPLKMRIDTARKAVIGFGKDYPLHFIHESYQLADLPPLPDPGPEPLWYTKGLRDWLRKLNIPSDTWDRVGDLPHVTADYLDRFYTWYHRNYPHHMSTSQMVDAFVAGGKPWENAAAPTDDDEDDEEE